MTLTVYTGRRAVLFWLAAAARSQVLENGNKKN
jgi:hypothetical protein